MSWGMVVVAGAGLVGAYSSAQSAKGAGRTAANAANNQLEFDKARLEDWNSVYGPIQDNLSNYYSSVTPEHYASVGIENFEKARQQANDRMTEYLAQRGIQDSGLAASLKNQSEINAAETKATIRRDAPRLAAEDQSRFLQIGLGQNPASSVSDTLAQQTAYSQQTANLAANAAGQAIASTGPAIGRAIDAYNNRTPTTPTTPGVA